jgi:hypothetical protein
MATMWRSNAVMYVTVPHKKVLFSILIFFTSQSELDFGIALVNNPNMECARNFVLVSEVQNGENVSSLLQEDSNMPWVDCTLNNLSENSFEVKKNTQTKLLAETLDTKNANLALITINYDISFHLSKLFSCEAIGN